MTAVEIDGLVGGGELDALIASHVFGREVLGWANCAPWHDCDGWHVETGMVGVDDYALSRPVYLDTCACAGLDKFPDTLRMDPDPQILGHTWQCLEPVPFYSAPPDPSYEFDIRPAWSIVRKVMMRLREGSFGMFGYAGRDKNIERGREPKLGHHEFDFWWYTERAGMKSRFCASAEAETIEVAICRAALKAVLLGSSE